MADTPISKTEHELIATHKKERKDLQAKIQILKKSICKGDKKKKKEVTEEIAKLESDLDLKQDEELAQLKISDLSIEKSNSEESDTSKFDKIENEQINHEGPKLHMKISKAQKRREKKEIAEKERNQRIIEQEALNVHGKRNIEIEAIKKILAERNLTMWEIPSDGNCLYAAVAHQLQLIGETSLFNYTDLRKKTAMHMKDNYDTFLPFMENPDSDELLTFEQYEKYCNSIAETSVWGGAVELQVLSNVLKCPIEVIQATGIPYTVGSEFESSRKLILTFHRHIYQLGAHYNSVTKISNLESS